MRRRRRDGALTLDPRHGQIFNGLKFPLMYSLVQIKKSPFIFTKNQDVSTEPLACPLARSLTPLTHSLVRFLTHSQARGKMNDQMSENDRVLSHSAYLPLDRSLNVSLPDPMEELPPFLEGAAIAEKPDFMGSTKRIKKVDPGKKEEQNK